MAFGKGLISMTKAVVKGGFVDLPLAFAKGLHHTPRFYGHKLREHGKVGGLGERLDRVYQGESGRQVKSHQQHNLTLPQDIWTWLLRRIYKHLYRSLPRCEGRRKEGTLGLAKGPGTGSVRLTLKPGACEKAPPPMSLGCCSSKEASQLDSVNHIGQR
ncbi:hypothetical protein CTA2_6143 [Colletotrichum tanaceti]|nr:hypothetical protein CTA2_6143 [Colletotrichum tanaceti]